jgi:hypothetical protein
VLIPILFVCEGAWWQVDLGGGGVSVSRVKIFNRIDGDPSHASLVSSRLSNALVSLSNLNGNTLKSFRIGNSANAHEFDINFDSYLGCFIDSAGRDLPYFAGHLGVNGQSHCIQACYKAGYQFAGTQHSTECWCGNSYGMHGVDHNGCSMSCAGNAREICGGPYRNSIYTDPTLVHKVRIELEGLNHLHMREVQVFDENNINRALNKPSTQSSTRDLWSKDNPYCGNPLCTQAVWDAIADGYSCGARITWLQTHEGKTGSAACKKVASEFPGICTCAPPESPSSLAVNGNLSDFSSTLFEKGEYQLRDIFLIPLWIYSTF